MPKVLTQSGGAVSEVDVAAPGIPIRPVQTAGYTFVLADANTCTPFNLASNNNATIPANATVAFPIGTRLYIQPTGASYVNFYSVAGVTIQSVDNRTKASGEWLCAIKTGTDAWTIYPLIRSDIPEVVIVNDAINSIQLIVNSGDLMTIVLDNNVTGFSVGFQPSDIKPALYGASFAARFQQDVTGGRTVAWPSSFKFVPGSDTVVQSAANAYTLLVATTFDKGVRWECVMRACGA